MKTESALVLHGPNGFRCIAPPASSPTPDLSADLPTDPCDMNRGRYFGLLNQLLPQLEDYGITLDDVHHHYLTGFGVERKRDFTQLQWAIAAAEIQAMVESIEIFLDRINLFTPPRVEFHLCEPCYNLHEVQGHGATLTRLMDRSLDSYCHACRCKTDALHIGYGHNLELTMARANAEYYFSKSLTPLTRGDRGVA